MLAGGTKLISFLIRDESFIEIHIPVLTLIRKVFGEKNSNFNYGLDQK